jgi:hypothetical protein
MMNKLLIIFIVYLTFEIARHKMMFTFNKSMQIFTAHAASEATALEMKRNFLEIYNSGMSLGVPMPNMERLHALIA